MGPIARKWNTWVLNEAEEDLAAVNARIATEKEIAERTGTVYPNVMANNAACKARLEHRIALLKKKLEQ